METNENENGIGPAQEKKPTQVTWGSSSITFSGEKPKEVEKPEEDTKVVKYSPHLIKEHEVIFDTPFLKVKKAGGYFYSERKGIDSVAFILLAVNASDERRIGLIHEYKDPIGEFLTTAFGGSIDDDKYHSDLRTLVKDEVIEEAGFDVSLSNIEYHGNVMVSTQSNQFCHLFTVEVDKLKQVERTTTNPTELKSAVTWISMKEVLNLQDWKAQSIILRRMIANDGLVYISTPKK
jgi:hypothetical protein